MKKLTVADIFELKDKRQLSEHLVRTEEEAAAAEAAGIDMLITLSGDMFNEVRKGAPNMFVSGAVEYRSLASETEVVRASLDVMVQQLRIEVMRTYHEEVVRGVFPPPEKIVRENEGTYEAFLTTLGKEELL